MSSATSDDNLDLSRAEDIRRFAQELGVTEKEIREAVDLVGPRLADVRRRLAQNRSY